MCKNKILKYAKTENIISVLAYFYGIYSKRLVQYQKTGI